MLIKCSLGVAKEWDKWVDKLCGKIVCMTKVLQLLENLLENYVGNLVRKFMWKVMWKVLLKNCMEELGKGKLCERSV